MSKSKSTTPAKAKPAKSTTTPAQPKAPKAKPAKSNTQSKVKAPKAKAAEPKAPTTTARTYNRNAQPTCVEHVSYTTLVAATVAHLGSCGMAAIVAAPWSLEHKPYSATVRRLCKAGVLRKEGRVYHYNPKATGKHVPTAEVRGLVAALYKAQAQEEAPAKAAQAQAQA